MKCRKCGNSVNEGEKYCPKCGKKVKNKDKEKIKISLKTAFIILIIIFILMLIIAFCMNEINKNNDYNNEVTENIVTENNYTTSIHVEGINEEERKELTEILTNLEVSSQEPWTEVINIDNKYMKVVNDAVVLESSSKVDENGYINLLTYKYLDLDTYKETTVSQSAIYVCDSQKRPVNIKYNSTSTTDTKTSTQTDEMNISYYDNGKIHTIEQHPKKTLIPDELEGVKYTFYYKENGDIDYISITMDFVESNIIPYKTGKTEFTYENNGTVTAKSGNTYVKYKKENLIDMTNLPLYFNTYLFAVNTDKYEIINENGGSFEKGYIPIVVKQYITHSLYAELNYLYNENNYIDISYNAKYINIKSKYDYIEKDNKLMQIKTEYNNNGEKSQKYIVYILNDNDEIDKMLNIKNIEELKQMNQYATTNKLKLIAYADSSKISQNQLVEICNNYGTVVAQDIYENPDITLNYCIIEIEKNNFDKAFEELSNNPNIYNVEQQ